jgi:predicted amidohydrolase YtcJ
VTRSEFLRLAALAAGAFSTRRLAALAQAVQPPTLIVVNARVFTMDDARPRAEAFAVKGDRFVAVGRSSEIRQLGDASTQVIDAAGMTVTPGFIDTHCHPSGVEELFGVSTNLRKKPDIIAALRKKAEATPPGFWVEGFICDDTRSMKGRSFGRTWISCPKTILSSCITEAVIRVCTTAGRSS